MSTWSCTYVTLDSVTGSVVRVARVGQIFMLWGGVILYQYEFRRYREALLEEIPHEVQVVFNASGLRSLDHLKEKFEGVEGWTIEEFCQTFWFSERLPGFP